MRPGINRVCGFTIIELMVALLISALLLAAMTGLINSVGQNQQATQTTNATTETLRFAMQRMRSAVLLTDRLMLPSNDNPATDWSENVRVQTVPASAPDGSSSAASAVLAVALGPVFDADQDGNPDADNDNDGRTDEDWPTDTTNDGEQGIVGIDDDGDGIVDDPGANTNLVTSNDEQGIVLDDPVDGIDNDGDGSIDEDAGADMNADGQPGVAGVDDDGDGNVDEGNSEDDDEDGSTNEDWIDVVAFYLRDDTLIERRPNSDPADGTDYAEYVIAENVTRFRVERLSETGKRNTVVAFSLTIQPPNSEAATATLSLRVGTNL